MMTQRRQRRSLLTKQPIIIKVANDNDRCEIFSQRRSVVYIIVITTLGGGGGSRRELAVGAM
jgi:hypothetical protein